MTDLIALAINYCYLRILITTISESQVAEGQSDSEERGPDLRPEAGRDGKDAPQRGVLRL